MKKIAISLSMHFWKVSLGLFAMAAALMANAVIQEGSWNIANTLATAAIAVAICFAAFGNFALHTAKAAARLTNRLARFRFMFDRLPQAILLFSGKGKLIFANKSYSELYNIDANLLRPGLTEKELISIRKKRGLPVYSDTEIMTVELDYNGEKVQTEVWKLADGRFIQFEHISTVTGGWIAQHRDVSAELKQQQIAKESRQFLDTVLQSVPSAIVVKDARSLEYEYVNNAVQEMNGWDYKQIVGKKSGDLFPTDVAQKIDQRDQDTLSLPVGKVLEREEVQPLSSGGARTINSKRLLVRDDAGAPSKLLMVIDDISERREAERKITYLATHDALTGLKNRAWFNEHIHAVNSADGDVKPVAVVLLDLDGFKNVNDTFGHSAGDMTLKIFAEKISKHFSAEAAVARLGGDEFAVFLHDVEDQKTIESMVALLIEDVSEPMVFEDHRVAVNCSAGVTFAYCGELTSAELISQADIALYEAKKLGKARYCVFTLELGGQKLRAKALEMRLRNAIEQDHLELYYQPIVDAKTGSIVSMEALVRWFDPEKGMIPPNDFIPLAEETGLIVPIGEMVLEKACVAAVKWPDHVRISVNISPIQFRDLNLAPKIAALLERTGLAPTRLELEITEATLLSDDSDSLLTLNALRETGVRIVMDDFGTGYSSLNYIRSFPFDKIKIDKSYVDELSTISNKSNVILHSVLSMARHLELRTTAEGVETKDQMLQLRDAGCSELQGYYFNKPMAETDVLDMFSGGEHKMATA